MKPSLHALRAAGLALDELEVAMCVFDSEHRTLLWNRQFLEFFPEHDGHVHEGEPYAANLRRFYHSRLQQEDLPSLERYVAEGIERHRVQLRPFDFDHRNYRLRASSVQAGQLGRVRFWRKTLALPVTQPSVSGLSEGVVSRDAAEALECIADGVLIADSTGLAMWANATFRAMYLIRPHDDIRGLDFLGIYRNAWSLYEATDGFLETCRVLYERQRFSGAPYEIPLPGDRWTRVVERRGASSDGRGYFSHVDITVLKRHQLELANAQQRLETLATTDALTGVHNRGFFDTTLLSEWRRVLRHEGSLSLLMIDIDHFKYLNDMHGHLSGDGVLKAVAEEISRHARRAGDVAARFGGEEFVLLMPNTDAGTAAALAETVRLSIAAMKITSHRGKSLSVTVSVGVSTIDGDGALDSPEMLIEHADVALYYAKRTGRDRIASYTGSMPLISNWDNLRNPQ